MSHQIKKKSRVPVAYVYEFKLHSISTTFIFELLTSEMI